MHCFSWTVQSLFDLPPVSTINALKSWVGSHVCGYHATHSIPIMGSLFIYTAGYAFSWKPAMAKSGSLICSWNLLVKKLANFLIAKKKPKSIGFYLSMEQMRGIEPPYQPWQGCVLPLNYICITGGPDGTRTHDLLRDREACYPLHHWTLYI